MTRIKELWRPNWSDRADTAGGKQPFAACGNVALMFDAPLNGRSYGQ
jgi:hypothetical protein